MANTIKQLIKTISNAERRLNSTNAVPSVIASELKQEMLSNLPEITDLTKGGGNDTGYVSTKVGKQTATLRWTGTGIWYIEFGTGIVGDGKYGDPERMNDANGYAPRPYDHALGQYWTLPMEEYSTADGKPVMTKGWVPYAPFYTTVLMFQQGKFSQQIARAVREQVDKIL